MSNNRVIGVLKRARALVAKGWVQRTFQRGNCFCAWGAVMRATKSDRLKNAAADALNADPTVRAFVTRTTTFSGRGIIIFFNDAPRRTQSQIVALFDRTIARLERQAS
jgi:hypothetical protein